MGRHSRAFLLAVALLTRLPVARLRVDYQPGDERLAIIFYPLVGAILGGLLWLLALGLATLPAALAAALLLMGWILLTGAMHLDGLADCTDAYFAGHRHASTDEGRKRILEVMREPTCGPMAVVALVMVLLCKWAALTALFELNLLAHPGWLVVLLLLPRTALLPYVVSTRYARTEGMAMGLAGSLPLAMIGMVSLLSVLLSLLLLPWQLILGLLLVTCLILLWWRNLWLGLIGGYTGDCLGGLIELLELALLVSAVAFLSSGLSHPLGLNHPI